MIRAGLKESLSLEIGIKTRTLAEYEHNIHLAQTYKNLLELTALS